MYWHQHSGKIKIPPTFWNIVMFEDRIERCSFNFESFCVWLVWLHQPTWPWLCISWSFSASWIVVWYNLLIAIGYNRNFVFIDVNCSTGIIPSTVTYTHNTPTYNMELLTSDLKLQQQWRLIWCMNILKLQLLFI